MKFRLIRESEFVSSIEEKLIKNNNAKNLDESLEPLLGGNAYVINSAYQVRDLLLNKPKMYRILYDKNIDSYMVCDADAYIHFEMIKDAFKQGYYVELENDEELDPVIKDYVEEGNKYNTVDSYVDLGTTGYYYDDNGDEVSFDEYLIYMIYVPDGVDEKKLYFSPSSDGYETILKYANGNMWVRDFVQSFKNNKLFNLLDRIPIHTNLT